MYRVRSTKTYRKELKRVSKHRNFDEDSLNDIIDTLKRGEKLELKYLDHQLSGEFEDCRECHVKNNLLLVYQKHEDILVLLLIEIGTHDDIFG